MSIYIGSNEITSTDSIKIGNTDISEIYVGSTKIWPSEVDLNYEFRKLDTLEHDIVQCDHNSICRINDTHFMLAYFGGQFHNDAFIKTFSIDGSGNITQIDSLVHNTNEGDHNSLIQLDSTHYALAYGSDGYLSTFTIDGNYDITQVDTVEHDDNTGVYNSLAKVTSTKIMLSYSTWSYDGVIKTFEFDSNWDITEIETKVWTTSAIKYNSLVYAYWNSNYNKHFFINAHGYTDSRPIITTFTCSSTFDSLTKGNYDNHVEYSNGCEYNSVLYLGYYDPDDIVTNAYSHNGDGYILLTKTNPVIGTKIWTNYKLQHDSSLTTYNSLVRIDDDHSGLAYTNSSGNLILKTFSYNISGLTVSQVDSYDDSVTGSYNSMCKLTDDIYVVAYSGTDSDGFVRTLELT